MRIGIGLALRRRRAGAVSLAEASWDAPAALPAWLTLTRATTGTYIDASGVLQSAAIDAARFDYSSGAAGLLVEGAETNKALSSNALRDNTKYGATNGGALYPTNVVTDLGAGTAPDGASSAFRMALSASVDTRLIQNIAATAGQSGVFAVYLRSSASGGAAKARLTTSNNAAWNTGISAIIDLSSSWTRATLIGALISSGANVAINIGNMTAAGSVDASCAGNIDMAFVQLSAPATFVTSYIPTTSAAVTRSADALALGGGYSSNPLIVETQSMATGAVSRTLYNPGSGVSALANAWLRKAVVYPIGTPTPTLDAIAAGGAW